MTRETITSFAVAIAPVFGAIILATFIASTQPKKSPQLRALLNQPAQKFSANASTYQKRHDGT